MDRSTKTMSNPPINIEEKALKNITTCHNSFPTCHHRTKGSPTNLGDTETQRDTKKKFIPVNHLHFHVPLKNYCIPLYSYNQNIANTTHFQRD